MVIVVGIVVDLSLLTCVYIGNCWAFCVRGGDGYDTSWLLGKNVVGVVLSRGGAVLLLFSLFLSSELFVVVSLSLDDTHSLSVPSHLRTL